MLAALQAVGVDVCSYFFLKKSLFFVTSLPRLAWAQADTPKWVEPRFWVVDPCLKSSHGRSESASQINTPSLEFYRTIDITCWGSVMQHEVRLWT